MKHFDSTMAPKEDIIPEVRRLLSIGKTQQEIADELNVSRSTIQRVMPIIKHERKNFDPMTFIGANGISFEGSPSVILPLDSFMEMTNREIPIIHLKEYRKGAEFIQFQPNMIIRHKLKSPYGSIIFESPEKWYNLMESNKLTDDNFIVDSRNEARRFHESVTNYISDNILHLEDIWFSRPLISLNQLNITTSELIDFILSKYLETLTEIERQIFTDLRETSFKMTHDTYFKFFGHELDWNIKPLEIGGFLKENLESLSLEILTELGEIPKRLASEMLKMKIYDYDEISLVVDGGFKNESDLEFAKSGGFKNMKEVRKSKKLKCFHIDELNEVITNKWKNGEDMRTALSQGFEINESNLYNKTVHSNPHLVWDNLEITWARNSSDSSLERLADFVSIRAMDFYDFLLEIDEPVYRTDRLMEEYNKLETPGRDYTEEKQFEEFLKDFSEHVEVTTGGLTRILFNTDKTITINPRLNPSDYPSLKKLKTKLAKSLIKSLNGNNLNDSITDAFSFLNYQLKKHLNQGEENLHVVDEVSKLLNLSDADKNTLHQARLARNWVSHKESEQKIKPRWRYVEFMLNCSQQLSEIYK